MVDWGGWGLALAATVASAIVTPLVRGAVVGGMDPITLLLLRLSLAVVLIGGSVALFDPRLLRLNRRGLWDVAWIGLISGVEICCFFAALAWVDGSMSAMIKSTQPLVVLLLLALGGERLTMRHGIRLLLAFVGIYLLVGPDGSVAPMGLLLLTLSIFLYATQLVFIQWRLLAYDSRTVTFYLLLVMTIVVAGWWGVQGAPWVDPGWRGWLVIGVLVVVSTYFARLALFGAMRRVGSGQVALLWPLQTLLAISLSVIFLNERFSAIQWVGGAFILTSALLAIEAIRPPLMPALSATSSGQDYKT
jgi:drug/metabolite transporter (DMT)-like permease